VRTAVFPGSFDPFTLGHLDVVRRGLRLFDRVIVAVAQNSAKSGWFTAEQRVALVRDTLAAELGDDAARVTVVAAPGLIIDTCREHDAVAIIKGLRGGADFDAEVPMALMNRHLSGVETVFIVGDPSLNHISSSLVKDIAKYGGDVTGLVAPPVARALAAAVASGSKSL